MTNKSNLMAGCLCALGAEFIYGMSYAFTKQAADYGSALALLGWRFVIAAIIMSACAVTGIIKVSIRGKNLRPLLMVALFSPGIFFICETLGIQMTTASESGVIMASIPVASLIASTLILKEKPAKVQVAGILITLAGVLVTVLAVGASSSLNVGGYLFMLVAVVSYALYCVYVDKASDYTGGEVTYVMLIVGAVIFGILSVGEAAVNGDVAGLFTLPFREKGFMIAAVYQGVCASILGFIMSNVAIAKIGVNRTSSFIGVSTVVSIASGAILLKETFTIYQLIGAVVILAGIYIANSFHKENE